MTHRRRLIATLTEQTDGANHARTSRPFAREAQIAYFTRSLQTARWPCFATGVTEDLVKQIAQRQPLRVVFRDAGFQSDAVKINVEQIFRLLSPGTEVRTL